MKNIDELIVKVMADFDRYEDSDELSKEQVLSMLRSDVINNIKELTNGTEGRYSQGC